jgi:hypothetical protein
MRSIHRSVPWILSGLVGLTLLSGCGRTPVQGGDGEGGAQLVVTVNGSEGPVPGAHVEVLDASGRPAGTGQQASEDGVATFENLPAGSGYVVTAEHDGQTGRTDGVNLSEGQKQAVTVQLKLSSGPGGLIAGTVKIAGTDRALPGAEIEVVGTPVTTRADESGHYQLANVPAGQQQVRARYGGYIDAVRMLAVKPGTSTTLVLELAPQSAGARAQNTIVTTASGILEVDSYVNPVANYRTLESWSAVVNRSSGVTLVADARKEAALQVTERGTVMQSFNATSWTRLGFGGLDAPRGASWVPNGNVLVADTGNDRIVEIDAGDRKVWELKGRVVKPRWAERLRTGNTLVADTGHNRLVEVNANGQPVWGLGDGSTRILNNPAHCQRLPSGNTLVADAGNNRVMEVNPAGQLVWMAGGGRPLADDDQPGLNNPQCAIRLPSGNTLIADTGNNRVVEVDARNTVVWRMQASGPLFVDRL